MKRLLLLAAAIVLVASQVLAASGVINCRGRVLDEKGEPVIGATVLVPELPKVLLPTSMVCSSSK